jgi:hypothetical protein
MLIRESLFSSCAFTTLANSREEGLSRGSDFTSSKQLSNGKGIASTENVLREDSMFIGRAVERHQTPSSYANNLTAFLGFLILGFPVNAATVRSTLAGWTLVAVATLQAIMKLSRSRAHLRPDERSATGE